MNRLRKIRKDAGVTQEDLAAAADVSRSAIAKLEAGKMKLTAEWAARLAPHIKATPAKLLFNEDQLRESIDTNVRIVRVKGFVQAGAWEESWEWDPSSFYDVPVPSEPNLAQYSLFGAETRGPSMNQVYPEGSILVFTDFTETGEAPELGRRYIIQRERSGGETETTVKTLWQDENGEAWLIPSSSDPRFQAPISLQGEDGDLIRIIGRVRYSVSRE